MERGSLLYLSFAQMLVIYWELMEIMPTPWESYLGKAPDLLHIGPAHMGGFLSTYGTQQPSGNCNVILQVFSLR